MADTTPPAGRRRREAEGRRTPPLGRPGEILLWLLTPAGTLLGWAPVESWHQGDSFPLRLPVALHQVPAGDGQGGVGLVQLYSALPVEEILLEALSLVGVSVVPEGDELAGMHAEAWQRRGPAGRLLVLPAAPGGLSH